MPRLSVYLIRASLIYLLVGLAIGGLILANKGFAFLPTVWSLLPLHIEFSFIGWMIQLAMGVAFWILPRFANSPTRGNEKIIWLVFILLNLGICFVAIQVIFTLNYFTFIGRVLETLAFILFISGNWKRIKPHGV